MLFRPDALRPHLRAFAWPEHIDKIREIVSKWAEMFRSQRAKQFNEKELALINSSNSVSFKSS